MPRLLTPLLVVALLAAACADDPATADGPVRAVATVFPLAWMAEQIAPDVTVAHLAGAGQDAHALELTPAERQQLEQADVVLYPGDVGFQSQVERAVTGVKGHVVSVAEVVGEDRLRRVDGDHDDDAHGDHDRGALVDPHVWFDPALMIDVAQAIGQAFAGADPGRASEYRANADDLAERLAAVDTHIDDLLTGCRFDIVFVSHEAYAYLLEPHGLSQEGISAASGHAEASPQRIAELAAQVRATGVPAVLSETAEGRAGAEAVAREAGVHVIEISSLDVVDEATAERGYLQLLREQAAAVARAAQCEGTR